MEFSHEYFMREAIKQAQMAADRNEVPVGAVIVNNNYIIAKAHNLTEQLRDFTAHAEMQAFTAASHHIDNKYLNECALYVTLEPCVMCAGASFWTRIGHIIYGASDLKHGALKNGNSLFHPLTRVTAGILEAECAELLTKFFKNKRELE